jgi:hypothetical protein
MFVTMSFCLLLPAQNSQPSQSLSDFKYQFKVGVLPFADNTGSGGEDLSSALSRSVQAEMTHSTDLEGRVLKPDDDTTPDQIDEEKAVAIGKAKKVDTVLIGTVLEATSEQSEHSVQGPSIFGQSLGGSSHSVHAVVTLQGDLYSVATGKKLASIRSKGEDNQNKVGANVSSSLGDLSSNASGFDNAPIGKALHKAVSDLVQQIKNQEAKMVRYTPASGAKTESDSQ